MKIFWREQMLCLIVFTLIFGSIAGIGSVTAHAAIKKSIRSIKVTQQGKNITKKTIKMKAGATRTLRVKTKPSLSKRNIKFKSTRKKVVSVDKNGKITAKKSGSARIKITVSKKGYRKKTTWVGIKVRGNKSDSNNNASPDGSENGKILVAYFSWSGTSERIAQNIISQTGADSFRIERETPYSDDYQTVAYGEAQTEAETNARPPLKAPLVSIAQYDKIVLCYPIWWHTAPMTVGTFLERYDFTGKMIYPVSQSGSMNTAQYQQSVAFIRECAKGATVDAGLFSKDDNAIRDYIGNTIMNRR